ANHTYDPRRAHALLDRLDITLPRSTPGTLLAAGAPNETTHARSIPDALEWRSVDSTTVPARAAGATTQRLVPSPWWLAGFPLLAVVAGAALLVRHELHGPVASAAPAASSETVAPTATAETSAPSEQPATVRIHLVVSPAAAAIELDGAIV